MSVETDQKYQETVEADTNMFFQIKQIGDRLVISMNICQVNKYNNYLPIPAVD